MIRLLRETLKGCDEGDVDVLAGIWIGGMAFALLRFLTDERAIELLWRRWPL